MLKVFAFAIALVALGLGILSAKEVSRLRADVTQLQEQLKDYKDVREQALCAHDNIVKMGKH